MERIPTLVMSLTNFCDTIYTAIMTFGSDLNVVFVRLDLLDAQQRRLEEGHRRLEEELRRLEEQIDPHIKDEDRDDQV